MQPSISGLSRTSRVVFETHRSITSSGVSRNRSSTTRDNRLRETRRQQEWRCCGFSSFQPRSRASPKLSARTPGKRAGILAWGGYRGYQRILDFRVRPVKRFTTRPAHDRQPGPGDSRAASPRRRRPARLPRSSPRRPVGASPACAITPRRAGGACGRSPRATPGTRSCRHPRPTAWRGRAWGSRSGSRRRGSTRTGARADGNTTA